MVERRTIKYFKFQFLLFIYIKYSHCVFNIVLLELLFTKDSERLGILSGVLFCTLMTLCWFLFTLFQPTQGIFETTLSQNFSMYLVPLQKPEKLSP